MDLFSVSFTWSKKAHFSTEILRAFQIVLYSDDSDAPFVREPCYVLNEFSWLCWINNLHSKSRVYSFKHMSLTSRLIFCIEEWRWNVSVSAFHQYFKRKPQVQLEPVLESEIITFIRECVDAMIKRTRKIVSSVFPVVFPKVSLFLETGTNVAYTFRTYSPVVVSTWKLKINILKFTANVALVHVYPSNRSKKFIFRGWACRLTNRSMIIAGADHYSHATFHCHRPPLILPLNRIFATSLLITIRSWNGITADHTKIRKRWESKG